MGRFAQADSIIPGAGNSQAWDRYAYTLNNPIRYTDPSGHRNCEEDGYNCPGDNLQSGSDDIRSIIKNTYDIEIYGDPGYSILSNLKKVLDGYASLAGGADNFNDILHDAMRANGLSGNLGITFLPQSGRGELNSDKSINWNRTDSNWNGFYSGAWCHKNNSGRCSGFTGNVIFSENVFTRDYQFFGVDYARAPIVGADLDLAVQITMAHEFVHVFADARPDSLNLYGGEEEDMANVLATYVVAGGANMSQSDLAFITNTQTQGLWNSTWLYPNWP